MRLLVDECLPRKLKFLLAEGGHECETVQEAGFGGKENGELLSVADKSFDVLITIDRNIRYQQNMADRRIAIEAVKKPRTGLKIQCEFSGMPVCCLDV